MDINYTVIDRAEDIGPVAEMVSAADVVGLDTEAVGLSPISGQLRMVQVGIGGHAYLVDLFKTKTLGPLADALRTSKAVKILQNAKFDQKYLYHHHGIELWPIFDTFRASALVYNGKKGPGGKRLPHDFYAILKRELGQDPPTEDMSETNWGGELTAAHYQYAATDVLCLPQMRTVLRKKLSDYALMEAALLEFGAVFPEACIELNGFRLDREAWLALAAKNVATKKERAAKLLKRLPPPDGQTGLFSGEVPGLNLDSPAQMLRCLKLMGIDVPDTNSITLGPLSRKYKILNHLLEYREVSKALSSFGPEYLKHINPRTGRIHTNFYPFTGAGRYSSSDPNLQQIPRSKDFRSCFRAEDGWVLIIADYCVSPATRILREDLTWCPAGSVKEKDSLIGFDETLRGRETKYRKSVVEFVSRIRRPCYLVVTDSGSMTASSEHGWVCKKRSSRFSRVREWVKTSDLEPGDEIAAFGKPWETDLSWEGGYLSGIVDGEGWLTSLSKSKAKTNRGSLAVGQNPGPVLDRTKALLENRGFDFHLGNQENGVKRIELRGMYDALRLIGMVRPVRMLEKSSCLWEGRSTWGKRTSPAKVLRVEFVGEQEVIAIRTSTRTLIAEGFLTHNSGVEMRAVADQSGDPVLLNVFSGNRDPHRATAAILQKKAESEVTKDERQQAKPVNFGLIFGMKPAKLKVYAAVQYGVFLSDRQAEDFYDRYFEAYKGVKRWQEEQIRLGQERGFTRTRSGRIRYLDRNESHNEFLNTPVQGSCADALKAALRIVNEKLKALGGRARMVHMVHDEIVLEARNDPDVRAETKKILVEGMQEGLGRYLRHVAPVAECGEGNSWADKG
jgi:DNA polymerase I-like protein with 3'-5' exonuclease and polymerase domains